MEQKLDIVDAARSNIGVRYRFGGASPATGFDCSGLVCWSYQQVGIQLPRSARDQLMFGTKVEKREDLKPGDIVVFKGTRGRTGWHSGIYTGNGMFVHSPNTGKTVTESRLNEKYYVQRYAGARRIPRDGSARELYAQYEAQQKTRALEAKKAKQSRARGRMLAASGKTDGAKKTAGGKVGKSAAGGKVGASASKRDLSLAKAGKRPASASLKAKTAKKARGDTVQAAKSGNGKTPAKKKNKS